MNLYNSYCYESLDAVAKSMQSNVFLGDGSILLSATVSTPNISLLAEKTGVQYTYLVTPPSCSELGFDSSYSGLNLADSIEMSWMALLVLASAFGIKVMRRGL